MVDDTALLRRFAKTGEEDAFAELVQRHIGLVFHSARRRLDGRADLAEDISQEVFALLAKQARELASHPSLVGWLYLTTKRIADRHLRGEFNSQKREGVFAEMTEPNEPGEALNWDQVEPLLDEAMDDLDDAAREAVLLRFFQNRPFAEIGCAMGVTEDAARMRVKRALERLREGLARRGITSTAAVLGGAITSQAAGAVPAGLVASVSSAAVALLPGGMTIAGGGLGAFMTTKVMTLGTTAVAVVSIGVAVRQASLRADAEQLLSTLQSQLAEPKNPGLGESAVAVLVDQPSTDGTRSAANAKPGRSSAGHENQGAADPPVEATAERFLTNLASSDELMAAFNRIHEIDMTFELMPIFAEMELSPTVAAQALELFVALHITGLEFTAVATAGGFDPGDPELEALRKETTAPPHEALVALLGEVGMERVKDLRLLQTSRGFTERLGGKLVATDEPLTRAQGRMLTKAFSGLRGPEQVPLTFRQMSDEDWAAFENEAAGILQERQFELFQLLGERERLQRKMNSMNAAPAP